MNKAKPFLIFFLLSTSTIVSAAIIHVPADQPTIQAGIDAAVNGDTVLVADGTYTGMGNKDLDFWGKAITVKSENGPDNCVIDCENNGRGFAFHMDEDENSIVDGFTIINGHTLGSGGGILCLVSSSPTIINNIISGCWAYDGGGGICSLSSSPIIDVLPI